MNEILEKLQKAVEDLEGMNDEFMEKRNIHDRMDVDEVIDIIGMYFNEFWETMEEINEEMKGVQG